MFIIPMLGFSLHYRSPKNCENEFLKATKHGETFSTFLLMLDEKVWFYFIFIFCRKAPKDNLYVLIDLIIIPETLNFGKNIKILLL